MTNYTKVNNGLSLHISTWHIAGLTQAQIDRVFDQMACAMPTTARSFSHSDHGPMTIMATMTRK
jgi:hypothetical protein